MLVDVTVFTADERRNPPGEFLLDIEQVVLFNIKFDAVSPKLRIVRYIDQSEVNFDLAPESGDFSVDREFDVFFLGR